MTTSTELSRIDQVILRHASSRSPEEISQMLNGVITPERVAAQAKHLLSSRSWLTAAEEDELVLNKLHDLLTTLEDRFLDNDGAIVQLRLLKEIGNRLDKRRVATQVDLETYDRNVARVLGQVVDNALTYMKGALRGDVDPELWDQLVVEAMRHAQSTIDEKAIEA